MEQTPVKQTKQKANWENRLLDDLVFIKKHGRYPLSKRTILPIGAILVFAFFLARLSWPVFMLARNTSYVPYLLGVVCLLGIVNVAMRYRSVLKFRKIITHFHVAENINVLRQFFVFQQLAYTQHPEAAEVFMILSRAIGGKDNHREVMIFIVDDKQILVNSHFIDQKFSVNVSSKQSRQMANMLREWVNKHINNSDSTAVTRK